MGVFYFKILTDIGVKAKTILLSQAFKTTLSFKKNLLQNAFLFSIALKFSINKRILCGHVTPSMLRVSRKKNIQYI